MNRAQRQALAMAQRLRRTSNRLRARNTVDALLAHMDPPGADQRTASVTEMSEGATERCWEDMAARMSAIAAQRDVARRELEYVKAVLNHVRAAIPHTLGSIEDSMRRGKQWTPLGEKELEV